MKTSLIYRLTSALTVVLILLSGIPASAAQQAPESPLPERLQRIKNPRLSRYAGVTPRLQNELSPQAPEALGDWSKIVYQTLADGDGEIYKMNGDLTNLVRLTNNTIADWYPGLDRGCARVIYSRQVSNPEVYRMNADGSSQTRLTNNATGEYAPAWSPDGTKIAYSSDAGGDDEIYRMTDGGASQTNLTNNTVDDWSPSWSPDGTRIAFASYRNGQNRIWVMNQDGSGQTQLNHTPNSYGTSWSPDGTQIAYYADSNYDDWTELWVMNSDGSNQHMIYDPPEFQTDAYVRSWSPDGRYITFTRVSYTYIDPYWYWVSAYMDAYDTTTTGILRLSYDSDAWNAAWQSCDNSAPVTSVAALPGTSPAGFTVNWSGSDAGGSEFKNFDVQMRDGPGGAWVDWQPATTATSAPFVGLAGHTYYFRSRGRDNAGNLEAYPASPDAFTTVDALAPLTSVSPMPSVSIYVFFVSWTGSDPGDSGIVNYDVQVRDGPAGAWTDWQIGTLATTAVYSGLGGHTYYFRSRATDYAGNLEAWPADYDTYTTVEALAPNSEVVLFSAYTLGEVMVSWRGVDPGGSGVLNYDVQVRDGTGGAWTDWQTGVTSTSAGYTGTPGHTVYFRARARDRAYNLEGWPAGDGDAATTFYAWSANGQVADNTGVPVVGAAVASTPPSFAATPSDANGFFSLFTSTTLPGPHTLQVDKTGYGVLPPANLPGDQEALYDAFLPPVDNQVQNWGFESGAFSPADWEAGGIELPTFSITTTHSGGYSARLGRQEPVFTPALNISQDNFGSSMPLMAMDSQDVIHVVWQGEDFRFYYAQRSSAGVWSASIQIPDSGWYSSGYKLAVDPSGIVYVGWDMYGATSDVFVTRRALNGTWSTPQNVSNTVGGSRLYSMALDATGVVHVAMMDFTTGTSELLYSRRALDGTWSAPENLTNDVGWFTYAEMAVEPSGVVHLVLGDGQIRYRQRQLNGSWTAWANISNTPGFAAIPHVALDQSGAVHVVWLDNPTGGLAIYHSSRLSNGTWTAVVSISQNPGYPEHHVIQPGPDGSVHVVWISSGEVRHVSMDPSSTWGDTEIINPGYNSDVVEGKLAVDPQGLAHVVWVGQKPSYEYKTTYARQGSAGGWTAPLDLSVTPLTGQSPQILVDPQGSAHITWNESVEGAPDIYYATHNVTTSSGESRIRQEVDIPAGTTTPVLSFLYRAEELTGDPESDFYASVNQGPITTTLFSTITDTLGWEHQWVDLTSWAGETVEIEFGVNIPAGSPYGVVYLDEVSLGSGNPDLWVEVHSDNLFAMPGETVVAQIAYGNQGGAPTSGTLITYTLPAELEFVSASIAPTVTPSGLVWNLPGLAGGSGPLVIEVTATVAGSAVPFNLYESQAHIDAAPNEIEVLNNQASISLHVGRVQFLPLATRR